jgi:hypothetical protein
MHRSALDLHMEVMQEVGRGVGGMHRERGQIGIQLGLNST